VGVPAEDRGERANDDGWFVSGERIVATGDDD